MEEDSSKRKKPMEAQVLEKVDDVISAISHAKHVDQVLCAVHSLAVLLFPLDSSLVSGSIDEKYRDMILSAKLPSAEERSERWQAFYREAAFPTMARVLLRARKHIYDVFFVDGPVIEVVHALVPCIQQIGTDGLDVSAVRSNTERVKDLQQPKNNLGF